MEHDEPLMHAMSPFTQTLDPVMNFRDLTDLEFMLPQ